jgi:hypothetical protein
VRNLNILVAVIEWAWTVVAVTGVGVCAWALIDSYTDRSALRREIAKALARHQPPPNGGAIIIVRMNLRAVNAAAVLHVFFLLLGLGALATPDQDFAPTLGFYGASYILVAAFNVRSVFLNQLDRVRVRRSQH